MENEKKNGSLTNESAPHKKNHKRGYFIEPVPRGDGAAPKITPAQTAPKSESGDGKKQDGASRKHHRSHQSDAPTGDKPEQKQEPHSEQAGGKENGGPSGNRSNRNRRNRSKPKSQEGQAQDPSAQANANQQKKEQNRPNGQNGEKSRPAPRKNQEQSAAQGTPRKDKNARHHSPDKLQKHPAQAKQPLAPLNDSEYEEVRFPAPEIRDPAPEIHDTAPAPRAEEKPSPMVEVVGIRFKSTGKVYYFAPGGRTVKRGDYAIVETARGQEYGEVSMGNTMVKESDTVPPLRPILRVATEADKQHHKDNKAKEEEAFKICNEKILSHGLDMKLIDAQYTFDNSKLLFYFTSAGRVDFRELVKDLASVFRTRIELRQIGIRDEAKLMGGLGMCGRPLCCTLFLSDFGQVSIKMAKEQNLSLNSAKISGICGRLMCCLRYEHETYEYEIKHTPPVDSLVRTEDGNGVVTEINPLAGTIKVRLIASPETPPKVYKREDVTMLQKKQSGGKDKPSDKSADKPQGKK